MTPVPKSAMRRIAAIALAPAIVAGISVGVSSAPAAAASAVTVTGTVTAESDPGVYEARPGVEVELYPLVGSGDLAAVAVTGATGSYSVSDVAPGRYRVRFIPPAGLNLIPEWLGDSVLEVGSDVIDVAGAPIGGVDAQLEHGSTISGTISYADGADAVGAAAAFQYNDATDEWERFAFRALPDAAGDYTIEGLPSGTFALRFGDRNDLALVSTVYWEDSEFLYSGTPVDVGADEDLAGFDATVGPDGVWVDRFAGPDRFATSVAISEVGFPGGSDTVFVVNGLNFPDALGAAPAAALVGAPILLVTPSSIPGSVKAELARLAPQTVFVIGGEPSVSASVAAQLDSYASGGVVRIAGSNRYHTSRLVADYFWSGVDNRTAYIATGNNFPDALSAGPAAANEWAPVIMVNGKASSLDDATKVLLQDLDIEKVVLAGGEPSVSAGVKSSIDALPFIEESYRRSGTNRYETSVLVNRNSFPLADAAFLATGATFPDALAGAALAGAWFAPVYLVQRDCVPSSVLDEIGRLHVRDVILLGGEPSLSMRVMDLERC